MKIIDKIEEYRLSGRPFYSFEYFPPKTEMGLQNLYSRLDRMASLEPCFIDVTWGAGGSSAEQTLTIARTAQEYFGLNVLMHLTCTGLARSEIKRILDDAKASGIRNVLALRGDPPRGKTAWKPRKDGFRYASDLTKFIRDEFGDHFSIGVGAYPEGHFEANSKEDDINNLKTKVDAGADFIITQLFYDMQAYQAFLARARDAGIHVPILPGLLPIHSYDRFRRFAEACQICIPDEIESALSPIRTDDEKVQEYGVDLAVDMCKSLLENGSPGIHFYTLNLESSVTKVLEKLGFLDDCRTRRALPWRKSTFLSRTDEDVRPIFWSNRPKSYLARTKNWDDFPNGRWGDSRSPTYGALNEYYMLRPKIGLLGSEEKLLEIYGTPETIGDIGKVFVNFCSGKIDRLPWCEIPVQAETSRISSELVAMNHNGFWTINSQPQVNGAPSSDPEVGWGGAGGVVYQKAYIEFFTSPEGLEWLLGRLKNFPTITYHAISAQGESIASHKDRTVNAVTWGVFPGKEIVQPTVVDSEAFKIWKDEAFEQWLSEWRYLYPEDSQAYRLLTTVHDTYFLVNLVENNFVSGDLFAVFRP